MWIVLGLLFSDFLANSLRMAETRRHPDGKNWVPPSAGVRTVRTDELAEQE
jgi:hypothetical protein